jgi:hypothetical protein
MAGTSVSSREAVADFEWMLSEGEVVIRIAGWDHGEDFCWLEGLTVAEPAGFWPTVEFQLDAELFREDPREYGERGRENMRSLLRYLGYRRGPVWTWSR